MGKAVHSDARGQPLAGAAGVFWLRRASLWGAGGALLVIACLALLTIWRTAAGQAVVWPMAGVVVASCITALMLVLHFRTIGEAGSSARASSELIDSRIEELQDLTWQLRDSEARYRDLLDTQQDVIARRDSSGRLTFVNEAFCRVFGVAAANVLGSEFEPTVAAEEVVGAVYGRVPDSSVRLVETASGQRWFAFEQHVVLGAAGGEDVGRRLDDCSEIQIVGRDVTEQRAFEIALEEARDNALAADRAKSRFLAAMSHEIRTPMNGIIGMTALLKETPLSHEQSTFANAISQSARTLMLLIDEILDFSKIEAGKLELASSPFALDACVQGVVELMAPTAHDKGLELAWTIDPAVPTGVIGDEGRVRQILLNLVGNAIKFTDRGGVMVTVAAIGCGEDGVRVRVEIKDTGIGLAPETVDRLFAEFGQADAPLAQRRGGTGLGLAISRRLAHAMDGNITVESEPDRGATFSVELKLALPAEQRSQLRELPRAELTNCCVLLAFDRLIERRVLAMSLRSLGVEVREAEDPSSHEQIDAAAQAGRPVALVIADASEEAAEAAAALERARCVAPDAGVRGIVLIDAAAKASLAQYRAAGFTSYLVRPVRPLALMAQVGLLKTGACGGADSPGEVGSDPDAAGRHAGLDVVRPGNGGCHRVLLAEDNAINALLACRMLEAIGCEVVHASDGAAAVSAFERSLAQDGHAFDLILMDVHMPRLDGLEAAAEIRRLAGTQASDVPPLVALTANAFDEDRRRCLEAGFDDYLAKPFEKQELVDLLVRWCNGQRQSAVEGTAA